MAWLRFSLKVPKDQADFVSENFENLGAVSVTLSDSSNQDIFEPPPGKTPLWQDVTVTGLFKDTVEVKKIWRQLVSILPLSCLKDLKSQNLTDKNWSRAWLKDFKPMRFGAKLWIVPAGMMPPQITAVNIKLDPGLAFGTGTHPTTALCLEYLDSNPPNNKTVIDYGTGSGVLALAASMLGAKTVYAFDIDSQALTATAANATKNNIDNIKIISEAKSIKPGSADLILANILARPLLELAEDFYDLLKPDGILILSGILEKQADEIINRDLCITPPPNMDKC